MNKCSVEGGGLEEGGTPLVETSEAVVLLFRVGTTGVGQPVLEEFLILIQHQELAQHHIGLVKPLVCQPLPQDRPYTSQLSHIFLAHRLPHKVTVLLRGRHLWRERERKRCFFCRVTDAVYAFAHALHNFLVENCDTTKFAPFVWYKENATCFGQCRELNGSSLLEYLDKVNFTSKITNNHITFNEWGSIRGHYEIVNYQASLSRDGVVRYSLQSVGTWTDNKQLTLKDESHLQFGFGEDGKLRSKPVRSECGRCQPGTYVKSNPSECCIQCGPCLGSNYTSEENAEHCSSCFIEGEKEMWGNDPLVGSSSCVPIPHKFSYYSAPWAIPSLILTTIGLLCVLFTGITFGVFWKHDVVKS